MKAVSDGLARLDGVADITIDLQRNLATITPEPGAEIDLAAIPRAVRDSGFTPGRLTIRARGHFEGESEQPRFRIQGWRRAFVVEGDAARSGEATVEAEVDAEAGSVRMIGPRAGR